MPTSISPKYVKERNQQNPMQAIPAQNTVNARKGAKFVGSQSWMEVAEPKSMTEVLKSNWLSVVLGCNKEMNKMVEME